MPLTITRPTLDLPQVKIKPAAEAMVTEQAELAQSVLRSYTPNRWKGLLYQAVGNMEPIPNGWGVGGPMGKRGLLPPPQAAPKGIISQFLEAHPKYATRNRGKGRRQAFPRAWHHLPREAQELLRDERMRGRYDSGAPAAPYWLIAEEGMSRVGVPARRYLINSRLAIRRGVPLVERKHTSKI